MKNKKLATIFIVLLIVAIAYFMPKIQNQPENQLLHKTFIGEIVDYEENNFIILNNDATNSNVKISISDETMYDCDELQQKIENKEMGIRVIIESEYFSQTYDNIYPAVLITYE